MFETRCATLKRRMSQIRNYIRCNFSSRFLNFLDFCCSCDIVITVYLNPNNSIFNLSTIYVSCSHSSLSTMLILASPTSIDCVQVQPLRGSLESGKFSFDVETLHRWLSSSRRWRLLFVRGKFLTLTQGADGNDKVGSMFYYRSSLVKIIFGEIFFFFCLLYLSNFSSGSSIV